MTLSEISSSLPTTYKMTSNNAEVSLANVRKAFGPKVSPLTPSLAKSLVGKTVFALEGQNYTDSIFYDDGNTQPHTKNTRLKELTQLKLLAFDGEELFVKNLKLDFEYPTYVSKGVYSSGSGADPIFVYVK